MMKNYLFYTATDFSAVDEMGMTKSDKPISGDVTTGFYITNTKRSHWI
jgi:hypothetical protein